MAADVVDEVDADSAGPFVFQIPVQAQRTQVPLELAAEQRRGLSAAGIARAVGAEQDEVSVGAVAHFEARGQGFGDCFLAGQDGFLSVGLGLGLAVRGWGERGRVCGCRVDAGLDQVGDGGRGDVLDVLEGREQEDCCSDLAFGVRVRCVWDGHVGGREHHFLVVERTGLVGLFCLEVWYATLFLGGHTPFLGSTLLFPTASITLPFSSAMSRTQSALPVATIRCVLQPLTWPYSLSLSSTSNLRGYLIVHDSQSCRQSSPSTSGFVLGNKVVSSFALLKPARLVDD